MIVWLNGTFGVGKTTTGRLLSERPGWRMFDPEHVGYLLMNNLRDIEFDDFQDLAPWRSLVPRVAAEIVSLTQPTATVAVQTVLDEQYWTELMSGFDELGLSVFHVVLDCEEAELRRRVENDEEEAQALQWRLDHIPRFGESRSWMRAAADLVVDTTTLTPDEATSTIVAAIEPDQHSA